MTNEKPLSPYQKAMLVGLFMSKFGRDGVLRLGFKSYNESYNIIGLSLGVKPNSIKNYRDEFAPLFPDSDIRGWHKRDPRPDRLLMYDKYGNLGLEDFADLIERSVTKRPLPSVLPETPSRLSRGDDSFARRLITGQAAEAYFRHRRKALPEFDGLQMKDTTHTGCGFDFRLFSDNICYGVEVKGLRTNTGGIMLTEKEYETAATMRKDYFLFVVKNLSGDPSHQLHRNPLFSKLQFSRTERKVIQISWTTRIS